MQRITGPASTRMPLGGPALTPAEIGIITSWIDQGARPAPNARRGQGEVGGAALAGPPEAA